MTSASGGDVCSRYPGSSGKPCNPTIYWRRKFQNGIQITAAHSSCRASVKYLLFLVLPPARCAAAVPPAVSPNLPPPTRAQPAPPCRSRSPNRSSQPNQQCSCHLAQDILSVSSHRRAGELKVHVCSELGMRLMKKRSRTVPAVLPISPRRSQHQNSLPPTYSTVPELRKN